MTTDETSPQVHEFAALAAPEPAVHRQAAAIPPAGRKGRWALPVLAGTLLVGGVIYSGIHTRLHAESQLQSVADEAAILTVNVVSPKAGAELEEIALPGNTQAFTDTPVYARANGYLKRWYADIGTHVQAGELLAEIDVPELDQQLRQAEADLLSAQANLELAKLTNTRWQELLSQRVVSAQEADQVKSDLGVKQALQVAAEANVRRLREMQNYERVVAPYAGVITARATDIGALVESGAGTPGRELFHLNAVQQLRVYVAVPETYAERVQTGSKVTITQGANASRTFTGTVARNANAIDLTTRTLNVEVDVDNEDGRLLPGAYVFVHLRLPAEARSVTVPANTLLFRTEGLRAAKVQDGKVSLVPIVIGHDFGSTVEVVSGLTPQDQIVVDPPDSLPDGAQVRMKEANVKVAAK